MYRVYSHSMINAALKHYKINKIALSLHVDTTQNTMVKNLGAVLIVSPDAKHF